MVGKNISKATAKNILLKKLKKGLQGDIELLEYLKPTGGSAYAMNGRDPVDFCSFM